MMFSGDSDNQVDLPIEQINRQRRDEALQETDWTQTLDAPHDDATQQKYRAYRQALRDITTHANWPDLDDDDWPTLEV